MTLRPRDNHDPNATVDYKRLKDAEDRYKLAMHAVQSGVAFLAHHHMMEGERFPQLEPKHLRVGINSALVSEAAVARLLIDRGVFTMVEYQEALATEAEREAKTYETIIESITGKPPGSIRLG